jgi:hypothetical protein
MGGVAVDAAGSVYITGYAGQSGLSTVNAAQPFYGGMGDAFVAKLKPDGSGFSYFTYLGGSGRDGGRRIAVDSSGNAYVTGYTCSINFPTVNTAQASYGGKGNFGCDAFAAKLDPTGAALVYSTYLGGSRDEYGLAIAADSSGNAYIAGSTTSIDFPTVNAIQAELGRCSYTNYACRDAFVVKLNASGLMLYSTYLGGTRHEQANGIAADAAGNAYITGITGSTDFPTAQAFQPSSGDRADCGGNCGDAFAAKLNPSGRLSYSTYLGGSGIDSGSAIAVDAGGNAYVTGAAGAADFPATDSRQAPARDIAFVAKLNAAGSALQFLTYFRTEGDSRTVIVNPAIASPYEEATSGDAIGLDAAGRIHVAGATGGWGYSDAFVVRFDSPAEP